MKTSPSHCVQWNMCVHKVWGPALGVLFSLPTPMLTWMHRDTGTQALLCSHPRTPPRCSCLYLILFLSLSFLEVPACSTVAPGKGRDPGRGFACHPKQGPVSIPLSLRAPPACWEQGWGSSTPRGALTVPCPDTAQPHTGACAGPPGLGGSGLRRDPPGQGP